MWSGIDSRNVLEWRLDPTSPDSIEQARQPGFTPIIVSPSCLNPLYITLYTPLLLSYLFFLLLDRKLAKCTDVQRRIRLITSSGSTS
jgi:hypothetical protein